jgi:hypothetical protein
MKHVFFILAFTAAACSNEQVIKRNNCGTLATVRDLRGLDGCGFVFELADGKKLEPLRVFYCGTPPIPKEQMQDPLINFEFVDGKQVKIGYELIEDQASICMVGPVVKITCIEEIATVTEN